MSALAAAAGGLRRTYPYSFCTSKQQTFASHPTTVQMDLLQRTGWRVRLDLAADVAPCQAALFGPVALGGSQPQEWAASMRKLCAAVRDMVSTQPVLCKMLAALRVETAVGKIERQKWQWL